MIAESRRKTGVVPLKRRVWMRKKMYAVVATFVGFTLQGAVASRAATKEFDFKDPKGVNAMSFVLDSLLEPIMGLATGISGQVSFDPAHPEAMSGKIVVAAESLHIENQGMEGKLHGPEWIDVGSYPEISFTFRKIDDVKTTSTGAISMNVTGDFTLKGITKSISISVRATHLPGRLKDRLYRGAGDLLVLRANFTINRKDFNIKPDSGPDVVAEEIEIRASIVGYANDE